MVVRSPNRMCPITLRVGAFALWLFVSLAPFLRADGIVLPPVAAPEVTMPDQRALLVWRDGTETLVIESRFLGASDRFAWVVPLPSRPEIKPATTGTLPALQAVCLPRVFAPASLGILAGALFFGLPLMLSFFVDAKRAKTIYSRILAVIFGAVAILTLIGFVVEGVQNGGASLLIVPALALGTAAWALWRNPRRLVTAWVLSSLLALLLGAMAIPAFSTVRNSTGPDPGALSIERQVIGDYEVSILAGEDGVKIAGWLQQNGFAVPAASVPVFAEHADAGGCFVATKLRRDAPSTLPQVPHPLVFTFNAAQPIYPMKLTGTGIRSALDLDLYVFADAVAHVDGLPLRACGRIETATPDSASPRFNRTHAPPAEDRVRISHAALRELCAGTTIATRLRGTLSPAQMQQDLTIQWRPFKGPNGLAKFTQPDACGYAALIGLGALLVGGAILFAINLPHRPSLRARLSVLAAAIAIGAGTVLAFPTTEVNYSRKHLGYRSEVRALQLGLELALEGVDATTLSPHQVRQRLETEFAKPDSELRHFMKALPAYGDAPNQYHLDQHSNGTWRVIWVDQFGQEQLVNR